MVGVKVKPGESIDRVLRRFRSEVKRSGIQRDAKKNKTLHETEREKKARQATRKSKTAEERENIQIPLTGQTITVDPTII